VLTLLYNPAEMGKAEVEAFLTNLTVEQNMAPSTQNQALQALLFLYHDGLERPIYGNIHALRAKKPQRLPTVLTTQEVQAVLKHLTGVNHLVALLLYGSGLHVNECLALRVKDIAFESCEITVRSGKGDKDRMTMLPQSAIPEDGSSTTYRRIIPNWHSRQRRIRDRDLSTMPGLSDFSSRWKQ
jgi:site-specific recombinase XerD